MIFEVQIINTSLNLVVDSRYYKDLESAYRFGRKREDETHTYEVHCGEFKKFGN